jgi:hypothetical protein
VQQISTLHVCEKYLQYLDTYVHKNTKHDIAPIGNTFIPFTAYMVTNEITLVGKGQNILCNENTQ